MISQEQIFKWIQEKDWWAIIEFIRVTKQDRNSDILMANALNIFVSEFFNSICELRTGHKKELLDDLYMMNSSKMFRLTPDEFEKLILATIQDLSLVQAYDYAKELPENPICREIVQRFEKGEEIRQGDNLLILSRFNINWDYHFNSWFKLINNHKNKLTYLSKPDFFKVCQKELSEFPSEISIRRDREINGKDMKRVDLYFDILTDLPIEDRLRIFRIFLKKIEDREKIEVGRIYEMLGIQKSNLSNESEQN